jgi:hypothetical protein
MLDQSQQRKRRAYGEKQRLEREDALIVSLVLGAGLFPISVMLWRRTAWGVQETIGLLIVMFALSLLTKRWAKRLRSRRRALSSRRMHRARIAPEE